MIEINTIEQNHNDAFQRLISIADECGNLCDPKASHIFIMFYNEETGIFEGMSNKPKDMRKLASVLRSYAATLEEPEQ